MKTARLEKKENMETLYKLTDAQGRTRAGETNETVWEPGWIYTADTEDPAELCTAGVLHAYRDPVLGLMLNPIHAAIHNPRLFEVQGAVVVEDWGKVGCRELECIRELPVPELTTVQQVAFGILCAMEVYQDEKWRKWAEGWLSRKDRTQRGSAQAAEAARAAAEAEAARAAARASARAAARAAAEAEAARAAARASASASPKLNFIALAHKAMEVK